MMRSRGLTCAVAVAVSLTAYVLQAGSPLLKDEAVGRKLYVNKCAKCHKFYDPSHYSETQWREWMQKMSRKAKLTPEQEKQLSKYVERQLRSPNGSSAIPRPPAPDIAEPQS